MTHDPWDHPIKIKDKSYGKQGRELYQSPRLNQVIKTPSSLALELPDCFSSEKKQKQKTQAFAGSQELSDEGQWSENLETNLEDDSKKPTRAWQGIAVRIKEIQMWEMTEVTHLSHQSIRCLLLKCCVTNGPIISVQFSRKHLSIAYGCVDWLRLSCMAGTE